MKSNKFLLSVVLFTLLAVPVLEAGNGGNGGPAGNGNNGQDGKKKYKKV